MNSSRRPAFRILQAPLIAAIAAAWGGLFAPGITAADGTWVATSGGTYYWLDTNAGNANTPFVPPWGVIGAGTSEDPFILGPIPNQVGDVANLNNNIAGSQTIILSVPITLGTLNIGDADSSHAYTIAPGTAGKFLLDVTSGNAAINKTGTATDVISAAVELQDPTIANVATGGQLNLTGTVSGATTLSKEGTGTLLLGGANTYNGGTTLVDGTVTVASSTVGGLAGSSISSGPLGTGTVTIASGGTATLRSDSGSLRTLANALIANADFNLGALGSGSLMLGGTVNLGAGSPRTITVTGNQFITGAVSGGSLSVAGTGTLHLRGANTQSTLTLGTGSTVVVGTTTALGAGQVTVNGATIASDTARTLTNAWLLNGDLTLGGNPLNAGSYDGLLTLSGTINLNGTRTITTNTSGVPTTITTVADTLSGVISGGALIKAGNGRLVLSATNTTITGITINQGVLAFGAPANLGNNPGTVAAGAGFITLNGGTLAYTGTNQQNAQTNMGVAITAASTIQVNDAGGTFVLFNNTAATITGTGNLNKTGLGALHIVGSANSSWSGTLNIVGGSVIAGSSGAASTGSLLAAVTAINVQSGGTFRILNGTAAGGISTDRVNNAAGITLNGGTLFFDTTPTAGFDYEETLGAITLNRGNNTITSDGASATVGDTSILTITNLVRTAGTNRGVVNFNSADAGLLGTSDRNRIILTNLNGSAPAAGFIGGWATVGTAASGTAAEWAKYDATNGVTAFAATDYNAGGAFLESSMTVATYHAKIAAATAATTTFGGARTAGSLNISSTAAAGNQTIAQAGFSYTIDSGGILVSGTATTTAHSISGGSLLVGSGNELLIHLIGSNALGIGSSINGSIAVIKSGAGVLTLTGSNGFTGGLFLHQGTIRLVNSVSGSSSALPTANAITVVNGILAGNSSNPLVLGNSITIHDSLTLGDATGTGRNILTGAVNLAAPAEGIASIIAHTNTTTTITGNISGGSLRIAQVGATGSVELAGNNTFASTDRIQVDSGLLGVGSSTALGSAKIVLNGGGIFNALGYRGKVLNDVLITASSTIGSAAYLEKTDLAGTVDLSGTSRQLTVNGIHQEISGRITNGGFVKEGNGVLIISGSLNDYLGGTTLNDGVTWLRGNATLGANVAGNNIDLSVTANRDAVLRLDGPQNIGSNQILSLASQTATGMPTLVLGTGFSGTTAAVPLIDFNTTGTGILNVRLSNSTNDKAMLVLDGWALKHDLIAETNAAAPNAQIWIGTTGANGSIATAISAGQGSLYRFGGGSESSVASNNAAGVLTLEANVLGTATGMIIGAPNATGLSNISATSHAVFLKGDQSNFAGSVTFGNGGTAVVASGLAMGTGSVVNLDMGAVANGLVAFRNSGYSGYTNVNNSYSGKNLNVISDSRIRVDADGGGRSYAVQFGTLGIGVVGGATRTFEVQDASANGEIQFNTVTANYSGSGTATLAINIGGGFTRFENGIAQSGAGTINLTKSNSTGTLIIDGTSALTGITTIQRGTVILTETQGLSSGGLVLGNGSATATEVAALHLRNDALNSSYNFGAISFTSGTAGQQTLLTGAITNTGLTGGTQTLDGAVTVSGPRTLGVQALQGRTLKSTGAYSITGAAAETFTINVDQGKFEISGSIDSTTVTTAITKGGRGILTLSGSNSFSSATTSVSISSGTLVLAHDLALGAAAKTVSSTGGSSHNVYASGTRTIANNIVSNSTVTRIFGGMDSGSKTFSGTFSNSGAGGSIGFHAATGGDTTFSGIISSSSTTAVSYFKYGQGRVILSGANTFGNASSGTDLTVARGTLEGIAQAAASPFGAATNDLIIAGGTLQLTGIGVTTNTSLATLTVGGTNLGGYLHLRDLASGDSINTQLTITAGSGQLTRTGRGALVIIPQFGNLGTEERLTFSTAPATINGILSPWLLTQTSAAVTDGNFVNMSSTNVIAKTYTPGTTQGDLNLIATTAVSVFDNDVATTLTANKSVFALRTNNSINLGNFDLSLGDVGNTNPATNNPVAGLILNNGAGISNGRILTNASETVLYVGGGSTSTISASIRGSSLTSSISTLSTNVLSKTGEGTLILSSTGNTYTGATNVIGGTLRAGATNALGRRTTNGLTIASGLTIAAGATFDMGTLGFDQRIGSLAGQGTLQLGNRQLIVGDDSTSTVFAGQITGTGTIIKTGTGALDFQNVDAANPNSFGNLYVDQGIARFVISEGAPLPYVVNDQFLATTTSSIPSGTLVTLRGGELRFFIAEDFGTGIFNSLNTGVNVNVLYGGTINSASGYAVGAFTENKFININNLTVNETTVTFSNANTVGVNVAGTTTMTNNARLAISNDTTFSGQITGSGNKGYTLNKTEAGNLAIANSTNDYAGGTVVTGGRLLFGSRNLAYDYVHNVNTFTYNSTAKAGTGDIWINPNSQIRLSETNLHANQLLYIRSAGAPGVANANQSRLEMINDASLANYHLRSTTSGALTLMTGSQSSQNGVHPGRYTQVIDLAMVGNGMWGLAAEDFDVTYDAATLGAGAGNTYRFFGGAQQLNFSRANVLTGTARVEVGMSMGTLGAAPGSSAAIVMINADQNYTGETVVHSNRTTGGIANVLRVLADLSPSTSIENYARVELNGSGRLTDDSGQQVIDYIARGGSSLRLDYDAGFAPFVSSQSNYLSDTSVGTGINAGPLTNKWQDDLAMTLVGSQLNIVNANSRDTTEIIGGLNVFGGGEIYLESRTAGATNLLINGAISMNAGSVLTFRALTNTVLNPAGASNRKVLMGNPADVPAFITVNAVTQAMISPRFVTATSSADIPYTFTTYDSVLGFSAATFNVTSAGTDLSTGANDGTAIVDVTAVATPSAPADILALRARQNINAGSAITIRSGGLILFPGTADTGITIGTNLNFANGSSVDAYIWTSRNTSLQTHTISGNITAAGLIVSGVSQLNLSGNNTFSGNATLNGGILQFNSVASANGLGSITLHSDYHENRDFGGGVRRSYARLNLTVASGAVNFNKDLIMGAGVPFAEFVQSGQDVEFTMAKLIFEDAGSTGSLISFGNGNNADLAFTGTTTLGGTLVNVNVGGSSNTVRLAGVVSGGAKLVKTGGQELRFDSEVNTFTGGIVINEGLVDMVSAVNGAHLGTGPVEINRGTLRSRGDTGLVNYMSNPNGMLTVRGNGTILDVRRVSGTTTIAHLWGSASSVLRTENSPFIIVQQSGNVQLRWVGDVVINDNPIIRTDTELDASSVRGALVFGNQLANTEVSGSGFIYKYGAGTLTYNYNAPSTYSGGIQVSQGILRANTVNDSFTTGSTGTGGIYIAPGASIHVQSLANLNNSSATIRQFHSNSTATAVLSLTGAALNTANPTSFLSAAAVTSGNANGSVVNTLGGGSNGGVINLQGVTYTGSLDMGSLFGGYWFLGGGVFNNATYSNATLGVGAGNVYRLGGGDGQIIFNQANVFTGSANLLIGKALAFQGGGTVQITNSNNFTGTLVEVTQSRNRFGESNGIQLTSNTLQTNQGGFGSASTPFGTATVQLVGTLQYFSSNGSNVNNLGTGNRNAVVYHIGSRLLFDNDNGVTSAAVNSNQGRWADNVGIALNGSVIQLAGEGVTANTTGQSETVGAVTFDRGSAARVVRQADDGAELVFASLLRTGSGTLTLTHTANILGTNATNANNNAANVERIMVSAGVGTVGTGIALESGSTAGTDLRSLVGNDADMLNPYIVSRSERQFTRYNATNGIQTYFTNGTTTANHYLRVQTSNQTIGAGRSIANAGITSVTAGTAAFGGSVTMANNGTEILDVSAVTATLGSDTDVLAVRLGGSGGSIVADAANLFTTLTIRSGGLIAGTTDNANVIRTNLIFGKAGSLREAFIYIDQNTLTIDGQIQASGITKFGSAGNDAGVLTIAQDQASFAGTWTVNGGTLQVMTSYGLGTNGTNEIVLNGFVNPDGGSDQNFKTELRFNLNSTGNAVFGDASLNRFYHGTITAWNQNTIRAVTANDRQYQIGNIDAKTTYTAGMTMPGVLQFRVDGSRTRLLTGEVRLFDDYALYVDASSFGPGSTVGVIPALINNQGDYDVTKLGDGVLYLGDMSGANGLSGSHFFTVNEGAVRVSSNGSFGTAAMTAIIDNGGAIDVAVANYASTATLVQQNGSIERWSVDGARATGFNLASGVHLQINADQTGTQTLGLNGGSVMGYLAIDLDEIAVIRTLGSNVDINLLADSFLGQPYVGGGAHRFYDIGKVNAYNNPFDPRLQGPMLQIKGDISGNFNLTKIGQDVVLLAGTNTYKDTIVREGVLMAGADNTLPGTGRVTTTANGVLDLNGFHQIVGSISGSSGIITSGATTRTTLSTGADGSSTTYTGVLAQSIQLNKVGAGELTLGSAPLSAVVTADSTVVTGIANTANLVVGMSVSGPGIPAGATISRILSSSSVELSTKATASGTSLAVGNTHNGGNILTGGKLKVFADAALGTAPSTAAIGSDNLTFNGGTLHVAETFEVNSNRGVRLNAGGGTVEVDDTKTFTISSMVAGVGQFAKTGTGLLQFNTASTHTGKTSVDAGTFKMGSSASLADSSWIEVKTGAVLDTVAVADGAQVDGVVSGTGTVNGSLVISSNRGSANSSGVLKPGGAGTDLVANAGELNGTLTINGNLTLDGAATATTRAVFSVTTATVNDSAGILAATTSNTLTNYLVSNEVTWNSATPGNHDVLVVNGTVDFHYNGQIEVINWNPVLGDVVDLMDWSTVLMNDFRHGGDLLTNARVGGAVGDLILPTLASGLTYDMTLFYTSGIVVVAPEPGRFILLAFGLSLLMFRRKR